MDLMDSSCGIDRLVASNTPEVATRARHAAEYAFKEQVRQVAGSIRMLKLGREHEWNVFLRISQHETSTLFLLAHL